MRKPSFVYRVLCFTAIFALVNSSLATGIMPMLSAISRLATMFEVPTNYDLTAATPYQGVSPVRDADGRGIISTDSQADMTLADSILRDLAPPFDLPVIDPSATDDPGDDTVYNDRPFIGPPTTPFGGWGSGGAGGGTTTGGSTGGTTSGTSSGSTTGSFTGSTSGSTAGSTGGVSGTTSGGTGGSTAGSTGGVSGTTTGSTGGSTSGTTGGSTSGTTGSATGGTTGSGTTGGLGGGTTTVGGAGTAPAASHNGDAYPWEGDGPGGGSSMAPGVVNTQTGNRLTSVPLVAWHARGSSGVNLTLFHNAQDNVDIGWGRNWRSSYDMSVVAMGQVTVAGQVYNKAIVTYPSGKRIEFFQVVNNNKLVKYYFPQNGLYDRLGFAPGTTKYNGKWTLFTPGGTTYLMSAISYSSLGGQTPLAMHLTKITDRHGQATTIARNGYLISTVTDSAGRVLTFNNVGAGANWSYNAASDYYTSVVSPDGRKWEFAARPVNQGLYGFLRQILFPSPTVLGMTTAKEYFEYDSWGAITKEYDKNGKTYIFGYDGYERLTSFNDPNRFLTNNLQQTSPGYTYAYDSTKTTITNPHGRFRVDYYDGGVLRTRQDEAGFSVTFVTRNANYEVQDFKDENGNHWYADYDSAGNTLWSQDPVQHANNVKDQYTYSYYNDLLTHTNALGATATYSVSSVGDLLSVTDETSRVLSTNTFTTTGDLASTYDGITTTYVNYDSLGRVSSVQTPDGTTTVTSYAFIDRPKTVSDAHGRVTTINYDQSGRATSVVRSDGSTVSVNLDAMNRPQNVTDWLSRTTSFGYDDAGRRISKTNPKGETEYYGYNWLNLVNTITDGNGNSRLYDYTQRGEVAYLQLADGFNENYYYDGVGNQTGRKDAMGRRTTYGYDARGLMTSTTYPSGPGVSYVYDNAGQLKSMTDSQGTTSWTYDAAGRETLVAQPQGSVAYAYDSFGRRTSLQRGFDTISYGYTADKLTSVTKLPDNEVTTFSYDSCGRLTTQSNSNLTSTSYSYDSLDRVNGILHLNMYGGPLSGESYSYDPGGNLSYKTVDGVTTTYGYDLTDQLTSESRTGYNATYTYDHNMNRLTRTVNGVTENYAYDSGDKLLGISVNGNATRSYTYDGNGNPTAITTQSGTSYLTYNFDDKVSTISIPNQTPSGFTYSYNGFGARTEKRITGSPVAQNTYHRAGPGVTDPLLSDGSATYNPGISMKSGGTTKIQHADRLGTNKLHTDSSGTTVGTQDYDAFGNLTSLTGVKNTLGFAGGFGYQEDDESGLKLLGHRLYDPSAGRFLTRDPIGFSSNWYAYCKNNPSKNVDETGLLSEMFAPANAELVTELVAEGVLPSSTAESAATAVETAAEGSSLRGCLSAFLKAIGLPGIAAMVKGCDKPRPARTEQSKEPSQLKKGKVIHKEIQRAKIKEDPNWEAERLIDGAGRADLVNEKTREVIEIKPNNPRQISSGNRQLERYIRALEEQTGQKWTGRLILYDDNGEISSGICVPKP